MRAPSDCLRAWLRPLTLPASRVYAAAVASRNRRFDRGDGVHRIDRPVISVGNITTGGTGKTPMVAWIARTLRESGHRPAIAMRGYKSPSGGGPGDEELEYRSLLPDVPVIAHPDRSAALKSYLPKHPETDCVLLDDGFQHRRLHRDLDLVLIDASSNTLHDSLLPAGNLREPPDSLARASAVIVTRADAGLNHGLAQDISRWHGREPLAWTKHAWTHLWSGWPRTGTERIEWLRGKRVLTLLGVGHPKSILAQIEAAGARVMVDIPAGDHERFDRAKILTARGLADGLDAMIVTRKDWVKIAPIVQSLAGDWRPPIIVPQLEIQFLEGEAAIRNLILSLASSKVLRSTVG